MLHEHKTVCLILACDGCGRDYDGTGYLRPHYDSPQDAREESSDSGWRTDGERDWCMKCQTEPHECAPDPEDRYSCARCGATIQEAPDAR